MVDNHDPNRIRKTLRFDSDDAFLIEKKAKEAGLSFNEFITIHALNSKIINKYSPDQAAQIHHDISQLTSHVNALSTTINKHFRKKTTNTLSVRRIGESKKDPKEELLEKILENQEQILKQVEEVRDKYDS